MSLPVWESAWQSAQTAIAAQDYEAALAFLQQAVKESDGLEPGDDRRADTLLLLGSLLARLNRIEEAEHAMSQAVRHRIENLGMDHPSVPASLYVMGEMLRQAGMVLEARHALVVAAEIMERLGLEDELRGQVEYSLAVVTHDSGLTTESLRHSLKAWPLLPEDSPLRLPMLNLAASLGMAHNDYAFAALAFERIADTQPPGPQQNETLGSLADMQLAQGQFQEALETVEKALLAQPDDANMLRRQGVARSRLGHYPAAEESLVRACKSSFARNTKAELTKIIGDVHVRAGEWQKAIERYQEALTLLSRHPRLRAAVRLALGKAQLVLGDLTEARLNFARAAGLRKRTEYFNLLVVAEAQALLGHVYNLLDQYKRARSRLTTALVLLENDHTPAEALAAPKQEEGLRITQLILRELALSLEKLEQFAEAAGVLMPVAQLELRLGGPEGVALAEKLVELYGRAGQADQAKAWTEVLTAVRSA